MQTPSPDKDTRESQQKHLTKPWLVGALIGLAALLAVLYVIFAWQPQSGDDTGQASPLDAGTLPAMSDKLDTDQEAAETAPEEQQETAPPEAELPPLNNSDDEALEALEELSTAPHWPAWVETTEVVRKFVATVDNLSQQKIAHKYIPLPKPEKPFSTVTKENGKEYIDPASYQRFNEYADTFDALDNDQLLALYDRFSPLLNEAFGELGYGSDNRFEEKILTAIDSLLAAPVIEEPIALQPRKSVFYKYADPELEALPSVQKQLIRMGPRNTRIIQRKLTELKRALTTQ